MLLKAMSRIALEVRPLTSEMSQTGPANGVLKAPAKRRRWGGVKRPTVSVKPKFRSGLEKKINDQLAAANLDGNYEKLVIKYTRPEQVCKYTPDFPIGAKPIIIEAKGYFRGGAKERQKMILVRDQNPHLDIRFVFQKASNPIYKGSPTSMSKWASDHGFLWSDNGVIPDAWIKEAAHG